MHITKPVTVKPWKVAAAVIVAFALGVVFWEQFGWLIVCEINPARCWSPG